MDIVYHIGAGCTDEDRLLKSLLKNNEALLARGVVVPGPSRYRPLIREAIRNLAGAPAPPGTRDVLIDAILGERPEPDRVERLVMSNWRFISMPNLAFVRGGLYRLATPKVSGLAALFPEDRLHLFFALRNPATFIPAIYAAAERVPFDEFLKGVDPQDILWSDVVAEIRAAAPKATLTVWCNEDTPYLWEEILRGMAGLRPTDALDGTLDLVVRLLPPEAIPPLQAQLARLPAEAVTERRAAIADTLEHHALTAEVEEVVDVPGWTEATVRDLTHRYEADLEEIATMDGVRFLRP
ncbi:hypothetical protein AADZ90_010805 [Aestuariibius sp. 2305UL40-4]|uniref:hypothetical protein n=1 Tax=Aestuariibius violaceus TaxID=3234132 RepID=UPI00345EC653